MVFKAEDNVMELIWDGMSKAPDEDHLTLTGEDLEEIWAYGFVDTKAYSIQDWKRSFEPHKTPEGTYVLTKLDFLEKDKYRYTGEIKIPFEPLLINEGKYTDEGLQELIDQSIRPSCSWPADRIEEFFQTFKETYRENDQLIRMNIDGKRQIARLIYDNPSPTRRRELLFDAMFTVQMDEIAKGGIPTASATPEQAAKVQVSTFTTLPSSRAETAAKGLKSIEKAKGPKATGTGDEGVRLKKIRKSRKGFKG